MIPWQRRVRFGSSGGGEVWFPGFLVPWCSHLGDDCPDTGSVAVVSGVLFAVFATTVAARTSQQELSDEIESRVRIPPGFTRNRTTTTRTSAASSSALGVGIPPAPPAGRSGTAVLVPPLHPCGQPLLLPPKGNAFGQAFRRPRKIRFGSQLSTAFLLSFPERHRRTIGLLGTAASAGSSRNGTGRTRFSGTSKQQDPAVAVAFSSVAIRAVCNTKPFLSLAIVRTGSSFSFGFWCDDRVWCCCCLSFSSFAGSRRCNEFCFAPLLPETISVMI
mmetsp:Transcript_99912/g.202627  ORF Transcript_99912/g.202627 Transcript_99912/m.202627 type:complete len:274 (+) Transcript_99912:973-1794(+)